MGFQSGRRFFRGFVRFAPALNGTRTEDRFQVRWSGLNCDKGFPEGLWPNSRPLGH